MSQIFVDFVYFKINSIRCKFPLLSNKHHSLVILKPEAGLESKHVEDTAKKLQAYKSQVEENGQVLLLKDTEDFNTWQKSVDSKEASETLPKLSLKDIKPELPNLSYKVENQGNIKVLTHKADLNGLSSINFYFDTTKVPQDKLHYLSLLGALLGNVDTSAHNYGQLSNKMLECMGGSATFVPSAVVNSKNPDDYKPKITASLLVPDENIPKSLDIVKEIINSSQFNDKQKVKQIIEQNKSALQMVLTSGTGTSALMELNSYMSEGGRYKKLWKYA